MGTEKWVGIGSSKGLSDGTEPLPEPMLILFSEVPWHSPESNFTASAPDTSLCNEFGNYADKITDTYPRG